MGAVVSDRDVLRLEFKGLPRGEPFVCVDGGRDHRFVAAPTPSQVENHEVDGCGVANRNQISLSEVWLTPLAGWE